MRILIAEDDGASRLILKRSIQKLGYECEEAENGDQAWDLFVAMKPNVIISDWMMPGRDGVQLCQAVRAYPNDYYPYFMLLTALDDKAHTVQALEAGADDYLLKPLDRDDLQARLIVARRVTGLHGQLMEQKRELERLNAQLYEDGRRDPLTKIGNRLRMQEDLEGLAARASRYGHQFCLALCDVDYFKKYNDSCGHAAGDETLKMVARTLAQFARSGDTAYRFGGEEFLVVLPSTTIEGASIGMDRRRRAVERLSIPHPSRGEPSVVTMSVGVAVFDPELPQPVDTALKRADQALYFAKTSGRNRVAVYKEMDEIHEAGQAPESLPPDRPSSPVDSI